MIKKQLFKFIVVGIVNTIFYYLLYALFIYLGLAYYVSVVFATIIGIVFSYSTFSKMVFNSNKNVKSFLKFIFVYSINIALNIFLIKLYTYFDNNLYIAGLFATIIVAIVSFILNKFFVFKA